MVYACSSFVYGDNKKVPCSTEDKVELIEVGVLPEDYDFEAREELVPIQPGDVPVTYADTSALERDF